MASSNRISSNQAPGGVGDFGWARTSQIFATVPSSREESWSLKIVFLITAVLLGVELFIMFHKNHFFNLMGYTMIMLIFVQNFFDKLYMRITIGWIAFSILLDFLWLIVHAEVNFNLTKELVEPLRRDSTLNFADRILEIQLLFGHLYNDRQGTGGGFDNQILQQRRNNPKVRDHLFVVIQTRRQKQQQSNHPSPGRKSRHQLISTPIKRTMVIKLNYLYYFVNSDAFLFFLLVSLSLMMIKIVECKNQWSNEWVKCVQGQKNLVDVSLDEYCVFLHVFEFVIDFEGDWVWFAFSGLFPFLLLQLLPLLLKSFHLFVHSQSFLGFPHLIQKIMRIGDTLF